MAAAHASAQTAARCGVGQFHWPAPLPCIQPAAPMAVNDKDQRAGDHPNQALDLIDGDRRRIDQGRQ
jgi:hypothetical protein